MKKLISAVLCLAMLLASMTFVFADIEEEGMTSEDGEMVVTVLFGQDNGYDNPETEEPEDAGAIYGITPTSEIASPELSAEIAAETAAEDSELTIAPAPASAVFTDLNPQGWYMDAVNYCFEKGLMNGISETEFAPGRTITRAMAVTVLWRLDGEKYVNYLMPFEDINEEAYYAEALRWANSEKIVSGTSETAFEPGRAITREELSSIIYNYEKYLGGGFKGTWMYFLPLEDRAEISSFASESVYWLYMKQVMTGNDGYFRPKDNATRAEFAKVIMTYAKLSETESADAE